MINTAAFESLQRYKKLCDAYFYFDNWCVGTHSPYIWMKKSIFEAIEREVAFMKANKEKWSEEIAKIEKVIIGGDKQ